MKHVYIFRGTFDPLHKNHEAIIQYCLNQLNISSRVVIHINSRTVDKKSTKFPALWETRAEVIKKTLNGSVDIAPKGLFSDTIRWIKDTSDSDVKIIQVVGSDVFDKFEASSPKYNDMIDSYLVAIRSPADVPEILCGKPVLQIPLEVQQPNISSTAIRKLLLTGNKQEIEHYVSPATANFLLETMEYSPLNLSARNLILQNRCTLSLDLLTQIEKIFGNKIQLSYSENQGLSGDHLILIIEKDGAIKAICKLFQEQENAKLESNGYLIFQKFHLKAPLLYFYFENCICIEYVHGHKPKTIEEYKKMGVAFRTLHDKTKKDSTQAKPLNNINIGNATRKIATLKFNNNELENNIKEIFNILLFKYNSVEHPGCTIHGDAQPGNVLISDQNELVFIDLNGTEKSEDAFRDVYQMFSAIFWRAINGYDKEMISTVSEVKLLTDKVHAFFEGYNHTSTTLEKLFWKFYWCIRTLSLTYKERIDTITEEIFNEIVKQIKLFACEIFRECLSSDILPLLSSQKHAFWTHPIEHLLKQSLQILASEIECVDTKINTFVTQ